LLASGCCALPDELGCVEWVSNRRSAQAASKPASSALQPSPSPSELTALRGLTTDDIDSFKAMGVEVCLQSESLGKLWLVPAYTAQARNEIIPEHLATVLHALAAFPGSQVTSLRIGNKSKSLQETT
jgi:hypothetical protein